MSKKLKTQVKLKYKPDSTLPAAAAIKENWDLEALYYQSETVPEFEKDIKKTERAYTAFAKKYSNGSWAKSKQGVYKALQSYFALEKLPGSKALYYLFYRRELNASDEAAEKLLNVLEARFVSMGNNVLFFDIQLAKIPKKLQTQILKDPQFAKYAHHLKTVFDSAKYQLSEPEEKILSLRSSTSRGMWVAGTEKILNKKSIIWKGKSLPINGALMQFENLPHKERHEMWNLIKPVLATVGEVAENELVALAHDKKVSDELRGYAKPYSATVRSYDSTEKTLETLVSVIETRGYELSKRFYAIKKKILKKNLAYIDRNESIGPAPKIPLQTAVTIVRDVFYTFNPIYGEIFDEMMANGQVDVWPKKGKGGGAFCSSGTNNPTLVFLNHNDSLESLRTLAHEMGHAIHAYRSQKGQPSWYDNHSTLTAETASTFFESLVAEHLLSVVPDEQKPEFLNAFIGDKIGTMIMCIARFKFELEMHQTIRQEGGMSFKEMSAGLARHFGEYCGPAIKMDWTDGSIVGSKTHYRLNFYQYSYSFGEIGSSIMRNRYKKDSTYKKQVDSFLMAGDSDTVENIFKNIGIDMSKQSTFHEGLDLLEADIDALEQLVKKKK